MIVLLTINHITQHNPCQGNQVQEFLEFLENTVVPERRFLKRWYPSRASRACPESSTLSSMRPISKRAGGKRRIQHVEKSRELQKNF
jgi:hypothetical protein